MTSTRPRVIWICRMVSMRQILSCFYLVPLTHFWLTNETLRAKQEDMSMCAHGGAGVYQLAAHQKFCPLFKTIWLFIFTGWNSICRCVHPESRCLFIYSLERNKTKVNLWVTWGKEMAATIHWLPERNMSLITHFQLFTTNIWNIAPFPCFRLTYTPIQTISV